MVGIKKIISQQSLNEQTFVTPAMLDHYEGLQLEASGFTGDWVSSIVFEYRIQLKPLLTSKHLKS